LILDFLLNELAKLGTKPDDRPDKAREIIITIKSKKDVIRKIIIFLGFAGSTN
jgi:hypothetical protein